MGIGCDPCGLCIPAQPQRPALLPGQKYAIRLGEARRLKGDKPALVCHQRGCGVGIRQPEDDNRKQAEQQPSHRQCSGSRTFHSSTKPTARKASTMPAAIRWVWKTAVAMPISSGARKVVARPDSRSEERRVGKECVSTGRSRGSPIHEKKIKKERDY